MSWSDKELCIKCDGGGKVLLCNNSSCPLSVHEKCLGFPVKFDEMGRFYCPYCVYRKLSEDLNLAQERTLLRKKALVNFLDKKPTSEACRITGSKEPAWSLDNENYLKGARDPGDTLLEKADQQQDRFAAGCSERDLQSEDSVDFVEETDEDIDESAEIFKMVNTSNSAPSQAQKKQGVHKPQKTVENHIKDDCSMDPIVMEKEGGNFFVEADKVDDNDAMIAQETVGNIERTKEVLKTVALPQGDLAAQENVFKKRRSKAKRSSRTESETELIKKRRKYNDKNSNDDARAAQENVGNIEGAKVVEGQVQRTVALPQGDLSEGNVLKRKKRRSKAKHSSRTDSETELKGKHHMYNDKSSNGDARTAQENVSNTGGAEEVEEQVQRAVAFLQSDLSQGNGLKKKKRRSKSKRSSRTESETELNEKRRKYNGENSTDDARTAQETVGNIDGAVEVEEQVKRTVALPQGDLAQGDVSKKRRSKSKRSSRKESETELNEKRRMYNDENSTDDGRTAQENVGNIKRAEEVEEQVQKIVSLPQGDLAEGDVSKKRKRSTRTESETELNGKCSKYNDKNSNEEARTAQETVCNIEGAEEVEKQLQKTVALAQGDLAVQGNLSKKKKRRSEAKRSSHTESETELNGKRGKYNDKISIVDARTAQETVGNIKGAEEVEEQVERTVALAEGNIAQENVSKKRRSKAKRSSRVESETELIKKCRKYNDKNSIDDARTAQETLGNIERAKEVEDQVQRTDALPQGDLAEGNVKKKRRSKAKHSSRMESETELNGKRHKYNDKNSNDDARISQETVGNIEGAKEVEEQVQKTVTLPQGDLAVQGNVLKKRRSEAIRSSLAESETDLNGKHPKYNDKNSDDARTVQETVGNFEGAEEVEEKVQKTATLPQGDLAAQGNVLKKRWSESKRSSRTKSETELNGKRRKYNDKNSNDDVRTAQETVGNIEGVEEVEEQVERPVALPQSDLAQGNVLKKRSEAKDSSCTESETKFNGKHCMYNDKTSNESTDANAAQGNVSIKISFDAGNSTPTEAETESNGKCNHNDKNSNKFGTSQNSVSASRVGPDKVFPTSEPKKRTVPASRTLSGERRTPLPWTDEEVNMLKEGFGKICNDKTRCISWTNILDYGRHVFDGTRTPCDLKNKWRNLCGKDWKKL